MPRTKREIAGTSKHSSKAYVVHAYAVRFNEYSGQQLKVTASRAEGDDSALVQSVIAQPNGAPPLRVDWRVGKTAKG